LNRLPQQIRRPVGADVHHRAMQQAAIAEAVAVRERVDAAAAVTEAVSAAEVVPQFVRQAQIGVGVVGYDDAEGPVIVMPVLRNQLIGDTRLAVAPLRDEPRHEIGLRADAPRMHLVHEPVGWIL
jgi:hypothetical protein